ncbi:MAG TPA: SRPBCC domain-containing protein [Candidatus Limnocylindrales bacterium]|nr:SRPBCC domain-containing protein [Candidatus Limnocylindrales bacterium]
MTTTTDIPAIERRLELHAAPERVWRALTDPDELSAWFGQRAHLEPRAGGDAWFEWDGHGRFNARVEVFEPPRRLHFRWGSGGGLPVDAGPTTLVEFELAPRPGGGTVLRLRESGFRREDSRWDNTGGWLHELAELAGLVADEPWQAGIRRTDRFAAPVERVWRAFMDPAEFRAWWGSAEPVTWEPGAGGWFAFEGHGRFAMQVERLEAPRYLAWRWSLEPGRPLDESIEVVTTEWFLEPTEDGGTNLHLLETGFRGPDNHRENSGGWERDVIPVLRRRLEDA